MSKVYILMADGFEEIEGITVVDLLRRARIDIKMISITDTLKVVTSHNIEIKADILLSNIINEGEQEMADMLVLPGGMKGTNNLKASAEVDSLHLQYTERRGFSRVRRQPAIRVLRTDSLELLR